MGPLRRRISFLLSNGLSASFFLLAAFFKFKQLFFESETLRLSEWLLALQVLLAAIIFMVRQAPSLVSWKPLDVLIALVGTFGPAFFSLESRSEDRNAFGVLLQIFGTLLAMVTYVHLGRSLGIIPALRKIKTEGVYKIVRHPMYASYQFSNIGFILNHPTFYNGLVALLCLLSQVYRIYSEERVLEKDPAYEAYRRRVRWRLFPYVY